MNDYIKRWYPAGLALAASAISLAVFHRLPLSIAVHWDLAGNPNGWMPKTIGAFIMPVIILISWLTLRAAPRIDPRRPHYEKFTSAYDLTVAALLAMVFVMHLVLLGIGLGYPLPVVRIAPALIGAVFVVVGNVMPRARSNFMFGIRTPWTLSNERVWARTHRLAGYTMTGAGVAMILAAALLSPDLVGAVIVAAIVTAVVAPAVYSFLTFRRESKA